MMVMVVMVTASRGVDAARKRNCIASYFREEKNNGLKWVMSTGTQIRISHSHSSNEGPKISPGDGLDAELCKFHQMSHML